MRFIKFFFLFLLFSSLLLFGISYAALRQTNNYTTQPIAFNTLSRAFIRPWWELTKPNMRIFSPVTLGLHNQYNNLPQEILARSALAAIVIPCLPAAYLLANVSFALNAISSSMYKPYLYVKGEQQAKTIDKQFTLLSMNINFLPGILPVLFGGISTAKERVDALSQWLLVQNCDLVCLFEAFDEDACWKLYDNIKKEYAHFYFGIGSKWNGLNSGICIASKININEPSFIPYKIEKMQTGINRGYFSFVLNSNEQDIAHIFTTHLQSNDEEQDRIIRSLEIKQIIEEIKKRHSSQAHIPYILCGDLNMPLLKEYRSFQLINDNFVDTYSANIDHITKKNATATNYFEERRWSSKTNIQYEVKYDDILDYVLVYKNSSSVEIKTSVLFTFNISSPGKALSDHRALKSTIFYLFI